MNIKLKTLSALLLSAPLLYAGGDIQEVEPSVGLNLGNIAETSSYGDHFYAGLGYSLIKKENTTASSKVVTHAVNLQLGYQFHEYLAVELRAMSNTGKARSHNADQDIDVRNIGAYLKPQYTFKELTLYGLIGYGATSFDDGAAHKVDGLQYGAGASFELTDSLDAFVDYTHLYDDKGFDDIELTDDVKLYSINVGLTYKF